MFFISGMDDGLEIFIPQIKQTDLIFTLVADKFYDVSLKQKNNSDFIKASHILPNSEQKEMFAYSSLLFLITHTAMGILTPITRGELNGLLSFISVLYFISALEFEKIKIPQKIITNQKLEIITINNPELKTKLKDFRSLIVAMQGKNDDVTAHIGRKIFELM